MKDIKLFICQLLLVSTSAIANDHVGTICFGENLAKPASEHTKRLYLTVDDSDKLYFNEPHQGPILSNLDIKQDHLIKVYLDDQLGQLWTLNFNKLNAKSVLIWRSAGAWRMDPAECN